MAQDLTGKKVQKTYDSARERFLSNEPWGTSVINTSQVDPERLEKLEKWARENLQCLKCRKPIPSGDKFKMFLEPDGQGQLNVYIACFPCFKLEADGQTPWKPKLYTPVSGLALPKKG